MHYVQDVKQISIDPLEQLLTMELALAASNNDNFSIYGYTGIPWSYVVQNLTFQRKRIKSSTSIAGTVLGKAAKVWYGSHKLHESLICKQEQDVRHDMAHAILASRYGS